MDVDDGSGAGAGGQRGLLRLVRQVVPQFGPGRQLLPARHLLSTGGPAAAAVRLPAGYGPRAAGAAHLLVLL